ncbi:MAG: hypothetical protein ACOYL3_29340 [Desulfuromonadaceae bacterium]
MSVSGISSSSVATAYMQPLRAQQQVATQVSQQTHKMDTVTISKQAQKLASDGDPAALEAMESSAEKAKEKAKGKA